MIDEKKSKSAVMWLSGAHFINDIYTGMLNPLMPFIAAKLSFSLAFATVIISISHVFSSVLQPLIGYFADNIQRRSFIFWGLIMSSVFISFAPGLPCKWLFILFVALGSLGSSLFHPQALGIVSKFLQNGKKDVAKWMGIFMGVGALGFSLGPLVSSSIAQFFGLEKIAWFCIIGVVWALFMFKFVPKISAFGEPVKKFGFKEAFCNILTNKDLNILFFIAMVKTLITTSCSIFLPFLWKDMGYSKFFIGCALFAFTFVGGIASTISPWVEKKFGTRTILYVSMISTCPLLIGFILTYERLPWFAVLCFILTGAITMMASPVIMLLAQNIAPQYKSIISGFVNGFAWGVIAVLMSGLGLVAQNIGITNLLFWVSIIPVFASLSIKKIKLD